MGGVEVRCPLLLLWSSTNQSIISDGHVVLFPKDAFRRREKTHEYSSWGGENVSGAIRVV